MYPVMLDVSGRRCLVVGGGRIALGKIEGLIRAAAVVTVVAPDVCDRVEAPARGGRIAVERRPYRAGEAGDYMLVFAATDNADVNAQVADDAKRAEVWVNVVDVPHLCTFYMPAHVRRGDLDIAIGTSGVAPFAASRLRRALDHALPAEWADWVASAGRLRHVLREAGLSESQQATRYDAFFAATVPPPLMPVRAPTALELERLASDPSDASDLSDARRCGFVSLVGAGPGDPELLTLRAVRRLQEADLVLHDALVPCSIVEMARHAELVSVGKRARHASCSQEEIMATMVREARGGKRIVRLKSGDPFVLGRGGEEALALAEARVPFEVVPGVSAATAAPAAAGIPVTHRGLASGFVVVSGHDADAYTPILRSLEPGSATVVVLMGLRNAAGIADVMQNRGWPSDTPSAVILGAWTEDETVWVGRLDQLSAFRPHPDLAHLPGTIVIGKTVGLACDVRHSDGGFGIGTSRPRRPVM